MPTPRYSLRRPGRRILSKNEVPPDTRFPHEIISYFASFLWDDEETLKAISRVCRSWREASLRCFYRSVPIDSEYSLQKLQKLLVEVEGANTWIRELCLPVEDLDGAGDRSWSATIPTILASKLPKLYTIKFVYVPRPEARRRQRGYSRSGSRTLHARTMATFSQGKEVHFAGVDISLSYLWATIKELRNLQHLRIDCPAPRPNRWAYRNFVPAAPPVATALNGALKSLWLEGCDYEMATILDWVRTTNSVETLQSLTIRVTKSWTATALSELLPKMALTLSHLELSIGSDKFVKDQDQSSNSPLIDLSCCIVLETIVLHDLEKPVTLRLVNQLTFVHLKWILFDVDFKFWDSIRNKDCVPLDERLTQPDCKALREIAFRYGGEMRLEAVKSSICWLFPSLAAQGNFEVYASG